MLRASSPAWLLVTTLGLVACSATDGSPTDDDNPQGGSSHSGGQGGSVGGASGQGGSSGASGSTSNGGTAGSTGGSAGSASGGSLNAGSGGSGGSGGSSAGQGGSGNSGGFGNFGGFGNNAAEGGTGNTAGSTSGAGPGGSGPGGSGGTAGGTGGTAGGGAGAGGGTSQLEFVGNITTHNSIDTDGKTFHRHWDQITPENAGKWGSVQPNPSGGFNWGTLDAIYDYTERNGIAFKQHTFIWGSQQPNGSIGEAQVKNWMTQFCQRYPNTKYIDVVNEPPPHTTPAYADAIGGGTNGSWQWIVNAFNWAREACPNAVLILNDYNNIEWQNDAEHFIDIVKTIQAAGAPIDAVGAQAHDLDHASMTFETVRSRLTRLHTETNLPVYITELDLSFTDDQQQLEYYQQYFPLFRDAGYVKGITIWGWIYGKTWSQAPNSGLVRNGSPRPAMTWLMQELGRPLP
jgi:endo-1,4-beta-xylanase